MEQRELAIIGGGPAGYTAAIKAAQLGGKVTLIERDTLGGTCVNRGCIPTKSLLQSASVLWQIKRADAFGISVTNPSLDFVAVSRRKQKVVNQLVDDVKFLMRKNKIAVINGVGSIAGQRKVRVVGNNEEKMIEADRIIIATGSEPASLAIEGIEEKGVINSDEALAMEQLPKSMIIIGGGVIGLEFAQIFHRMNTAVTVIEMMPQLLPTEDAEIAQMLGEMLRAEGIGILTDARVKSIKTDKQGRKIVAFGTKEGEREQVADTVLIAVGRRPCINDLGLEKLGFALDGSRVLVNGRMETNIQGIYAIGDVVGGHMLAHVAMVEGRCAAQNAMGIDTEMDYRAVPRCIYTQGFSTVSGISQARAGLAADTARHRMPMIDFKEPRTAVLLS